VKAPNILYIFTDDQSRRSVSAYDEAHDWVNTPNIDALAASGMRFRTCYTGASCQMSRAMMMTGRLQHAIRSFDTRRYPACDYDPNIQQFWPANFRKNGYKTACIGKWHLGEDVGHGRDWDYSVIWDRAGPKENGSAYYYGTLVRYNGGERVPLGGYSTDRYTELAVDYIENRSLEDGKPWFLWLCYGGVHGPYTEADRHTNLYADAPHTEIPSDIFGPRPGKPKHLVNYTKWRKDEQGNPEGFDRLVKKYNRAVASLDEGVGKLIEALKKSGQLKNTLVVFTSDQGFAWGQHGCREKWMGYDANIAAPLIFSFPGRISPGQVCKEPVTGLDIVRAFHTISGINPVIELHGRDMSPLLTDPAKRLHDPLLFTHTARLYGDRFLNAIKGGEFVGQKPKPAYLMMCEGKYKYIRHMQEDTIEELYDLEKDAKELNNLAVNPEYTPLLKMIREKAITEIRKKDGEFIDHLPDPKGL
jgi:arylsulfatase A-like enzyme